MELYDEEIVENERKKNLKMKKYIKIGIILTTILIIALIIAIMYLIRNPNKITVYINGIENEKTENILKPIISQKDDSTIIYVPIRDFASIMGITSYNGGKNYTGKYEDTNSCCIEPTAEGEVAIFTADSNVICKIDITEKNESNYKYEYVEIANPVVKINDKLYVDLEGIEVGFNTIIQPYNEKNKKVEITTLNSLIASAKKKAPKSGFKDIDELFVNKKALLSNMMVVVLENGKKGVIDYNTGRKTILQSVYDEIIYVPQKQVFIVKDASKVGIIGSDGVVRINPKYDDLLLIDSKNDLYLAQTGNRFGVIDINENPIIHLDYERIGVDISQYRKNNIKNGYVLLDSLIPVQQDGKWGFFKIETGKDAEGKKTIKSTLLSSGFSYEDIGCITKAGRNVVDPLMVIEDYGVIVVKKGSYYGFIDTSGTERLGMLFTDIYMETSSAQTNYYMIYWKDGKTYNVIESLEKAGITKIK